MTACRNLLLTALLSIGASASVLAQEYVAAPEHQPVSKHWAIGTPWRIPQDTTTALNDPDRYAWQLFVALNWPADTGLCRADTERSLGDVGPVVWETWQSREETFLDGAVKPPTWRMGCQQGGFYTPPSGDYTTLADETVRLNKDSYRYIRSNKLYSLDEQERLAAAGVKDIKFPLGAKEVKAHWVLIDEADKDRYHWYEVVRNGVKLIYGLSGLHITSKDMPTWFWSTFEHVDNEYRWPTLYPAAFLGWQTASVDRVACPPSNLSCNAIPREFGLEGTRWENYRLRGTQIDWVSNRGVPTTLANSQMESFMDLNTSSCITCHALAVKGETGDPKPLPILKDEVNSDGHKLGFTGPLNPSIFLDAYGNEVKYLGLDYVWTLRKAKRESTY